MNQAGSAVLEPIILALFLTPLQRVVTPDHPFLGERECFTEAVLLNGILAEAKREKVPPALRNAMPWNLLP